MLYPLIRPVQQGLPTLIEPVKSIPNKFSDSTHQLWHCQTVDGPMVLKLCNHNSIEKSSFWLAMNNLFGCQFPLYLSDINSTYQQLKQYGKFAVPELMAVKDSLFVLSRFIGDLDLDQETVTDEYVIQLAHHLGSLHQNSFATWGRLATPQYKPEHWQSRLQDTLENLLEQTSFDIADEFVEQAFSDLKKIQPQQMAIIMVDLRWDQLRQLESGRLAVVDLDAFVIGPIELELVIVEYLLNEQQSKVFKQVYQGYRSLPDLNDCRSTYRLLLFLMNILGEQDVHNWFQVPTCFD